MDITRPSVTFEEFEIPVYNSRVYLVGKHNWDMVTVNLRDDVNGGVTKLCGEQVQKQFDMMEQSSASSGIDYKFITRFEVLDGGNGANAPSVLETWELYGCFIQNINYGDLNYATQELQQLYGSRFDNAVQTLGDGIGLVPSENTRSTITG